jgi:hypothetical protein
MCCSGIITDARKLRSVRQHRARFTHWAIAVWYPACTLALPPSLYWFRDPLASGVERPEREINCSRLRNAFSFPYAHPRIYYMTWHWIVLASNQLHGKVLEKLVVFLLTLRTNYPVYSIIKLHVSGILSAHHQEFSTVHSALVSFMQVLMTVSKQSQDGIEFHPDSAWIRSSKPAWNLPVPHVQ